MLADVNKDGVLDVATANGSGTVNVLLGNPDGTFQPVVSSPAGAPASLRGRQPCFCYRTLSGAIANLSRTSPGPRNGSSSWSM